MMRDEPTVAGEGRPDLRCRVTPPCLTFSAALSTAAWLAVMLAAVLTACEGGGRAGSDAARAHLGGSGGDTVVFGEDRLGQSDSARRAFRRREPDRALLEALLESFAGLTFVLEHGVADSAVGAGGQQSWAHDRRDRRVAARLERLLADEFGERYAPAIDDSYRRLADSLAGLQGEAPLRVLDDALRRIHLAQLATIDSLAPSLDRPTVRAAVMQVQEAMRREAGVRSAGSRDTARR